MQPSTGDILKAYEKIQERAGEFVCFLENDKVGSRVYTVVRDLDLAADDLCPTTMCIKITYTYVLHGEESCTVVQVPLADWENKDVETLASEAKERNRKRMEAERSKHENARLALEEQKDRAEYARLKEKFDGTNAK